MELNERIFSLLDQQGKTAKQLGKFLDVSPSSISGWKNEGSFPSSKYLVRISEFFNVSLDYLCTGKDSNNLLSEDQKELLENYDKLDHRGKHKIHSVIYDELDRIEQQTQSTFTERRT